MQKEGWFDQEGWKITGDWFPDDKFSNGKEAVVGDGVKWSQRAWSRAHDMWQAYGVANGLYLSPETLKSLEDAAGPFRKAHRLTEGESAMGIPLELLGPGERQGRDAHEKLYWRNHFLYLTNFPHYYFTTQVELDPVCIELRKTFDRANRLKKAGDREAALDLYKEAMPKWRALLAHKEFREDDDVQETSYEAERTYLGLVADIEGNRLKQLAFVSGCLGDMALRPPTIAFWIPPAMSARNISVQIHGPFDYVDPADKKPLIPVTVKNRVRDRLKLPMLAAEDQMPPAGAMIDDSARCSSSWPIPTTRSSSVPAR